MSYKVDMGDMNSIDMDMDEPAYSIYSLNGGGKKGFAEESDDEDMSSKPIDFIIGDDDGESVKTLDPLTGKITNSDNDHVARDAVEDGDTGKEEDNSKEHEENTIEDNEDDTIEEKEEKEETMEPVEPKLKLRLSAETSKVPTAPVEPLNYAVNRSGQDQAHFHNVLECVQAKINTMRDQGISTADIVSSFRTVVTNDSLEAQCNATTEEVKRVAQILITQLLKDEHSKKPLSLDDDMVLEYGNTPY